MSRYDWQAEDRRQEREYLKRKKEEERQKIKEEPNFRIRLNSLIIFKSKEREYSRRGRTHTIKGTPQGATSRQRNAQKQYTPHPRTKSLSYQTHPREKKWKRTTQNEKIIDPRKVIERWIERTYAKYTNPNPNRAMENLPDAKTELPFSKLNAPDAQPQIQKEEVEGIDWQQILDEIAAWYNRNDGAPDILNPLLEWLDEMDKWIGLGKYNKKNYKEPPKSKPLTQHQSRSEA